MAEASARRRRRLAEELEEAGLVLSGGDALFELVLEEIDHALRPTVHERRVATSGSIIEPEADPDAWREGTSLDIERIPIVRASVASARLFADGLSSWLVRRRGGGDEWVMFNRAASSERDLVVVASAMEATVVQRHPSGVVRVVGEFGVLRWEGLTWHLEPKVTGWMSSMGDCTADSGNPAVLKALLTFAVHDLGSLGIGALLIYRHGEQPAPVVEERLALPPPLQIRTAFHLAALRHALAQVDGAAVFDAEGVLHRLGVRLIPSGAAEDLVDALGGTRHTSARRYSYDDTGATVIAVSADGPVTVFRNGHVVGRSSRRG